MSQAETAANVEVVKAMLGGVGQEEVMRRHLSPYVVLSVPTGLPYGRDFVGFEGYSAIVGDLMSFWETFELEPPEFAATGDKVVVISRLKGKLKASGRTIDQPFAEIWQVQDGKVVRVTPFYYDTKAISES